MPLKKNHPWNVLVFPAASEIGLEIHRALRDSKEVILHGANLPGLSAANFHFQKLHELPSIHEAACLPQLQKLISDQKIDAIFPAYDDVQLWLSENAQSLEAEIITSPAETVRICRSKSATYKALNQIVNVPQLWALSDSSISFPVFVKPDCGQGSQRARRIDERSELDAAFAREPDLLITENLPGSEYTVDCFSQRGRGVMYAQARSRLQTKTGISTLSQIEDLPLIHEWAKLIANRLELYGTWFFQVKEDSKGDFHLLEVAPRIAGSMALNRVMGPNFPLLALYEAAGHDINIDTIDAKLSMSRSLDTRFIYDQPIDTLYIDLDDTLILREHVNTRMVALVFQFRNKGVPVHLITRHKKNLDATLAKFRLAHLFDSIIHIPEDTTPKAQFITETNAVLIDDSFQERHTAKRMLGIRCFDAAGAICLFDERT